MQERKKYMEKRQYIIGENNGENYILSLTEAEKKSIENFVNLFSKTKFELLEVKEKTDEREEAIKYFNCRINGVYGCSDYCVECNNQTTIDKERAFEIALKYIQGYKSVMKWLQEKSEKEGKAEVWDIAYVKAILDVINRMKQEFDINEVTKE